MTCACRAHGDGVHVLLYSSTGFSYLILVILTYGAPWSDSLAVCSVRDALTECEAAAAIVQRWLAEDRTLSASEIGIILPAGPEYTHYLSEAFANAGLTASSLPAAPDRRNVGGEVLLHFLQCRRRPAPAMALASLYCSPVLCWSPDVGSALAHAVMAGDFQPMLVQDLNGKQAALFSLIRSASPTTNGQLKEQIRSFLRLLSEDELLASDVAEAKQLASRLLAVLIVIGNGLARDAFQLAKCKCWRSRGGASDAVGRIIHTSNGLAVYDMI